MPQLPQVQQREAPGQVRAQEVLPGPLKYVGRGFDTLAQGFQEAADQQDSLDVKKQAALLDAKFETLRDDIREEPDFAKRNQLYEQKAQEYLGETTAQIGSSRVQKGLKQYYDVKFPTEAIKTNRDVQKEWGQSRVAQTDEFADILADRTVTTDDPREVAKYKTMYGAQLDQLASGKFPAINAIQKTNMEQAFGIKVLDRRAKKMIGDNADGFLVAADEHQFDGLPDLEKYRTMARGKIEGDERRADKITRQTKDVIMNDAQAAANNGRLSNAWLEEAMGNKNPLVTPAEARALKKINEEPPTGAGSDQVKAIASEYYLGARSLPRINATLKQLQSLQMQLGKPDPLISRFANELQSDRTTMENQGISREANDIQRQNREVQHLKTDYEAEKPPGMKVLDNLLGNQDTVNKAKIEAEYRRNGAEAAKKLKENLTKGQKGKTDKIDDDLKNMQKALGK
jgi:hypothetical protein